MARQELVLPQKAKKVEEKITFKYMLIKEALIYIKKVTIEGSPLLNRLHEAKEVKAKIDVLLKVNEGLFRREAQEKFGKKSKGPTLKDFRVVLAELVDSVLDLLNRTNEYIKILNTADKKIQEVQDYLNTEIPEIKKQAPYYTTTAERVAPDPAVFELRLSMISEVLKIPFKNRPYKGGELKICNQPITVGKDVWTGLREVYFTRNRFFFKSIGDYITVINSLWREHHELKRLNLVKNLPGELDKAELEYEKRFTANSTARSFLGLSQREKLPSEEVRSYLANIWIANQLKQLLKNLVGFVEPGLNIGEINKKTGEKEDVSRFKKIKEIVSVIVELVEAMEKKGLRKESAATAALSDLVP